MAEQPCTEASKIQQRFELHLKQDEARFNQLLTAQEKNTAAINKLIEETRGAIQLHQDLQTTIRIGSGVQKFGLWIVKWPLIGAGLYAAWLWILQHIERLS